MITFQSVKTLWYFAWTIYKLNSDALCTRCYPLIGSNTHSTNTYIVTATTHAGHVLLLHLLIIVMFCTLSHTRSRHCNSSADSMYAMGESTCELTKEEGGGGGGRRGREESDAARLDSISTVSHQYHREKLTHFKSRLKLHDLSQNELELKAALYFHICNPLKRWRVEKLVPYKLVLQVFKTFLLVVQVFHLPFLSLSSLLSFSKLLFIHHLILFFVGHLVCKQHLKLSLHFSL